MPVNFPDRTINLQTAIASAATAAALLLLGLVLAYWTWAWLAPRPAARAPAAVETTGRVVEAGGLFGNARRDQNAAASAGFAIKLLGIVAARGRERGYAVVQLDTRQILAVREGEDIAPGIRLAEVHVDRVILDRSGARETLAWPDKKPAADSPAVPINK